MSSLNMQYIGDKKMKECVECGKNLGIMEGYRHPTLGKEHLLCSTCFDTVIESVEKYREVITPYIGFFNKETSTIDDIQKIGNNILKNIKKIQCRVSNLWSPKTNQHANETLSIIN
jgi:hypothetical protein